MAPIPLRLGILGVGHLAMTLLEGWRRAGGEPSQILLSPRGHGRSEAAQHGYQLAADNADLVARCDIVLLAVRPAQVQSTLEGLPWRPGQILVSACAGVPLSVLSAAAGGVSACRIMPLTAAAIGASPTTCFPALPEVLPLLQSLGPVIPLAREEDFEIATVSAAVYGWALSLIASSTEWAAEQGLSEATARELTAATFVAAGKLAAEPGASLSELLSELVTPGGITERGLNVLEEGGVPDHWRAASQAVLEKLTR